MAGLPKRIWVNVAAIAAAGLVALYVLSSGPDMTGRADACLGTTDPIERGVIRNTCDHAISVLACPRNPADGDCEIHSATLDEVFNVRADVAVIAHACLAPYRAAESPDGDVRICLPAE